MSKPWNWACWAWLDHKGATRYVGVGAFTEEGHPAKAKFAKREQDNSPLHLWLQSLDKEPTRQVCGAAIMPKRMAYDLAAIYRARAKSTLLDFRGTETRAGGGHKKAVAFAPDDFGEFRIFRSVREAGRWARVNPSTITRRCQSETSTEWVYVEEIDDSEE